MQVASFDTQLIISSRLATLQLASLWTASTPLRSRSALSSVTDRHSVSQNSLLLARVYFGAAGPFEPEKPFGSEPLFGSKEARSGQTLCGHGCDFWEAEWRWVTLSSRSAPPSAPPSRFELSWRQLLVGSITQPVGGQNVLIGIISPTCPSQIGVSASRASVGFTFVQFQCALSAMRRICSNVRVSGCGSWWSALLRAQSRHGRFEREQKTRVDPRPTLLVSLGSHFLSAPSLQWWL